MVVVIDYGAGNLFSISNALKIFKTEYILSDRKEDILNADKLILPGVGAFPEAMKKLNMKGLGKIVSEKAKDTPLFGICLGFQMLFEKSFEFEETEGLGLIPGEVKPLKELVTNRNAVVPHMGWNNLTVLNHSFGSKDGDFVYFIHSYAAVCKKENIAAYVRYCGAEIPATVFKGNVFGTQFHPEKSGEAGMRILEKFLEI